MDRNVAGLCLVAPIAGFSHPMGNFSISHYSRLTFGPQSIDLLYLIDMAEIPAFQEKPLVDLNGNGTVEASEQDAYLSRKVGELTEGLVFRLNGTRCPLARISQQLELLPGGLNLPTLKIALKYQLPLKADTAQGGQCSGVPGYKFSRARRMEGDCRPRRRNRRVVGQ